MVQEEESVTSWFCLLLETRILRRTFNHGILVPEGPRSLVSGFPFVLSLQSLPYSVHIVFIGFCNLALRQYQVQCPHLKCLRKGAVAAPFPSLVHTAGAAHGDTVAISLHRARGPWIPVPAPLRKHPGSFQCHPHCPASDL